MELWHRMTFTLVHLTWLLTETKCSKDEFNLLRTLWKEYDPAARPVNNVSDVVNVKMEVVLFQIRELNEKNQYLQLNAWVQFHWNDPKFMWNYTEYGGVKTIRVPYTRVWVPDIVLYNSVDETRAVTEIFKGTNVIVSYNGYMLWIIPAILKSSCKIDVRYFPFDEQSCPLKFGSWTYDGFQLDLTNMNSKGNLLKYIESGEWDLVAMPAKRNVEYYSCCAEPYVDVTYTIIIRRRPMFFTYNLVFPCVLLMGIGILVFCLPPESGEKVSLGVTVLLAMTVYQLLIAEAIPPTSEVVPLIGQFFGATISLLSLSSAMTVLIMKLHFSGEHGGRVPGWLRTLVLVWLARLVRMNQTTIQSCKVHEYGPDCHGDGDCSLFNRKSSSRHSKSHARKSHSYSDENSCGVFLNSIIHSRDTSPLRGRKRALEVMELQETGDTSGLLGELLNHVKQLTEELHQRHVTTDAVDHYKSEWRMVALVLDRILLIIFFIITVFTSTVIFVNVPD